MQLTMYEHIYEEGVRHDKKLMITHLLKQVKRLWRTRMGSLVRMNDYRLYTYMYHVNQIKHVQHISLAWASSAKMVHAALTERELLISLLDGFCCRLLVYI